jgi:acyl-CoA thioesterase YciA
VVCCYTEIVRTGRTSITLSIEVWAMRQGQGDRVKVTDATFTFVAVDEDGRPRCYRRCNDGSKPPLNGTEEPQGS